MPPTRVCHSFCVEAVAIEVEHAHVLAAGVGIVVVADARVLPGGTAHIADVGMTGSRAGVIGVRREQALRERRQPDLGHRIAPLARCLKQATGEICLVPSGRIVASPSMR